MLNANEVKEKFLTLSTGNALLSIIPEVRGCNTRYCLKTEEQVLELLLPATPAGLAGENPLEMLNPYSREKFFPCLPMIPRSFCPLLEYPGSMPNISTLLKWVMTRYSHRLE